MTNYLREYLNRDMTAEEAYAKISNILNEEEYADELSHEDWMSYCNQQDQMRILIAENYMRMKGYKRVQNEVGIDVYIKQPAENV